MRELDVKNLFDEHDVQRDLQMTSGWMMIEGNSLAAPHSGW
jgi:hypothetical protein